MFKTADFRLAAKEGFGGMSSLWQSISHAAYNRNVPTGETEGVGG